MSRTLVFTYVLPEGAAESSRARRHILASLPGAAVAECPRALCGRAVMYLAAGFPGADGLMVCRACVRIQGVMGDGSSGRGRR